MLINPLLPAVSTIRTMSRSYATSSVRAMGELLRLDLEVREEPSPVLPISYPSSCKWLARDAAPPEQQLPLPSSDQSRR